MPPFRLDPVFTPTARPAARDRADRGGDRGGRPLHHAARRHRHRQDDDDGRRDPGRPAAGAGHRAQQDARRAALQRVPHVLPGQRGRVLRLLLRLLPARGLRRLARPLHREGLLDQLGDRPAAPRRHRRGVRAPRRDRRRLGLLHLRPRLAGRLRAQHAAAATAATTSTATSSCASSWRSSTRATTRSLARGNFRVRGETLEVFPAYAETAYRAVLFGDEIETLSEFDPLTGEVIAANLEHVAIWPATHYNVADGTTDARGRGDRRGARRARRAARVRGQAARGPPPAPAHAVRHRDAARDRLLLGHRELLADPRRPRARRAAVLPDRLLPARLRLLHRRVPPDDPADRRHVRGRPLAQADARRVRLPPAERARQPPADASTSSSRSRRRSCSCRPRPASTSAPARAASSSRSCGRPASSTRTSRCGATRNQIDDLMREVRTRVDRDERVLVTTLTKKMAEDLSGYLLELGFRARYLHSEIDTLERIQIIRQLRLGEYDVLVGVNLLREGLDLPEVLAGRDPRRRQGGLPARRDLADPDDRPRRAQRRGHGDHVRRHARPRRCAPRSGRPTAAARSRSPTTRSTASPPRRIVKGVSDISDFLTLESKTPRRRRRAQSKTDELEPHELEKLAVELEEEMLAGGRGAALRVRGAAARRAARAAARPRRRQVRRLASGAGRRVPRLSSRRSRRGRSRP